MISRKFKPAFLLFVLFVLIGWLYMGISRSSTKRFRISRNGTLQKNDDGEIMTNLLESSSNNYTVEDDDEVGQVNDTLLRSLPADDFAIKMEKRRSDVQEICNHIDNEKSIDYIIQNKRWALHFMLVDDVHKNILCFIPKTGNTNWKKVYMVLTGLSNATDENLGSISFIKAHNSKEAMQLKNQKITDDALKEKLTTYTKTISVRHPFERLLSAYNGVAVWYEPLKHRDKQGRMSPIAWPDFVDHASSIDWNMVTSKLTDGPKHWTPYFNLCHPCTIKYDYILNFDNMVEEANAFLRDIKAPSTLQFPAHSDRTPTNSSILLKERMNELTGNQIDQFYEAFKADFEMFKFQKIKK